MAHNIKQMRQKVGQTADRDADLRYPQRSVKQKKAHQFSLFYLGGEVGQVFR